MKTQGYTLIEVIVVLFVLAILSAFAVPYWLSFWQRQRIRTAANQLQSALYLARQEANKNSVRYAVTVCSSSLDSLQSDGIQYSLHPYSDSPSDFMIIEDVSLVQSTFRRSPKRYNLLAVSQGDCYTAYLGLFPDDGYALGFFYLSHRQSQYVHRVGFNTLIGNVVSCPVVSLEQAQCR